jgi:hypothetical protein
VALPALELELPPKPAFPPDELALLDELSLPDSGGNGWGFRIHAPRQTPSASAIRHRTR